VKSDNFTGVKEETYMFEQAADLDK